MLVLCCAGNDGSSSAPTNNGSREIKTKGTGEAAVSGEQLVAGGTRTDTAETPD